MIPLILAAPLAWCTRRALLVALLLVATQAHAQSLYYATYQGTVPTYDDSIIGTCGKPVHAHTKMYGDTLVRVEQIMTQFPAHRVYPPRYVTCVRGSTFTGALITTVPCYAIVKVSFQWYPGVFASPGDTLLKPGCPTSKLLVTKAQP